MPVRHFLCRDYLHILFYIKFLLFCSLAPDKIRILGGKIRGCPENYGFYSDKISRKKRIPVELHSISSIYNIQQFRC